MPYSLKDLNETLEIFDGPRSLSNVRSAIGSSGQISMKEFINEKTTPLENYISNNGNWQIVPPGYLTVTFDETAWMTSSGSVGGGNYVGNKYSNLWDKKVDIGWSILYFNWNLGKYNGPAEAEVDYDNSTMDLIYPEELCVQGQACAVTCDVYDVGTNLLQSNYTRTFELSEGANFASDCANINESWFETYISSYYSYGDNWNGFNCNNGCWCLNGTYSEYQYNAESPHWTTLGGIESGLNDDYNDTSGWMYGPDVELYVGNC